MAEVAEAAGVARATVFNHFGSKHALIEGITEDVLGGYQTLLQGVLAERDAPVPSLVRRLFDLMGEGIEEDRRFHRAAFREIAKLSLGLDVGGPGQRLKRAAARAARGRSPRDQRERRGRTSLLKRSSCSSRSGPGPTMSRMRWRTPAARKASMRSATSAGEPKAA